MKSLEQTMLAEDPKKPRRIIDYLHSAFMIVVTSPVRCISKDSKSLLKVRRKPEQDRKATIFNKSARRGSTNKFRLRRVRKFPCLRWKVPYLACSDKKFEKPRNFVVITVAFLIAVRISLVARPSIASIISNVRPKISWKM